MVEKKLKKDSLNKLRKKIDLLDENLLKTLAERRKTVEEIFVIKKEFNLPARNKSREKEMLGKRKKLAKRLNLNADFAEKLFKLFIRTSLKENKLN